jgi:hypothetical protein
MPLAVNSRVPKAHPGAFLVLSPCSGSARYRRRHLVCLRTSRAWRRKGELWSPPLPHGDEGIGRSGACYLLPTSRSRFLRQTLWRYTGSTALRSHLNRTSILQLGIESFSLLSICLWPIGGHPSGVPQSRKAHRDCNEPRQVPAPVIGCPPHL